MKYKKYGCLIIVGCCTCLLYWLFFYINRVIFLMMGIGGLRKDVVWDQFHPLFFTIEICGPLIVSGLLILYGHQEQYKYVITIFFYPIITLLTEVALLLGVALLRLTDVDESIRIMFIISMCICMYIGFLISRHLSNFISQIFSRRSF